MGINTLEELKTFRDFLMMKGESKKYSIREVLKVADVVYPWIDGLLDDYRVRHRVAHSEKCLEFNIKVPDYFCNIGELIEDIIDPSEEVERYVWETLYDELRCFMEDNAPEREYFVEGRSGGWLLVEHYFIWGDEYYWENFTTKEKLEELLYEEVTINQLIDELDEIIFWEEFIKKLEERKKVISSEEYAQIVVEDLRENYEEWVITEYEYYKSLLEEVSV